MCIAIVSWCLHLSSHGEVRDNCGIVPFVTSRHKGRFVVFLKKLFIDYFKLGDCPTGIGNWPCRVRAPEGARNRRKATVKNKKNRPIRCDVTKGTIPRNFRLILFIIIGDVSSIVLSLKIPDI